MQRREITAEVVAEVERLLANRHRHTTVAKRLGISPYVVTLIAGKRPRRKAQEPAALKEHDLDHSPLGIDVGTMRMAHRLLAAGRLKPREIAQELGISDNIVSDLVSGKRKLVTTQKPMLMLAEQFYPDSVRCSRCETRIHIVPCRACMAKLRKSTNAFCRKHIFSPANLKRRFNSWELFALLVGKFNYFFGGPTMPDLLPFLSSELTALWATTDKREALIVFAEKLFDQVIEKIDLPGPDAIIDPLLKAAIRPLVGRIYDQITKKLEVPAHA